MSLGALISDAYVNALVHSGPVLADFIMNHPEVLLLVDQVTATHEDFSRSKVQSNISHVVQHVLQSKYGLVFEEEQTDPAIWKDFASILNDVTAKAVQIHTAARKLFILRTTSSSQLVRSFI